LPGIADSGFAGVILHISLSANKYKLELMICTRSTAFGCDKSVLVGRLFCF